MDDLVFAGNKALYLVLILSGWPTIVATIIGLPGRVIPDGNAITGTDAAFWH